MPARLRLTLATLTACALAAVLGVGLANRGGTPAEAAPNGLRGSLRPPGVSAGPVRGRDEGGRAIDLTAYRGRPVIVAFLYTTCRDTCPLIAQQVRQALDQLGARAVPAVAVSVDPAGDTPDRARAFNAEQFVVGRLRWVLGSRAQLAPVWRRFGIAPQTREDEHSAYVVLVDGAGRQRVGFPQSELTPEALAHDVRVLAARTT